jgi:hypothetical protein
VHVLVASRKIQGVASASCERHAPRTRSRSSAGSSEGVPPPKYTVSNGRGSFHSRAARATSATRCSTKRLRAGTPAFSTEKSQYGQIAEQNGTWR